jgi:hypothetical protein
VEVDEVDQLQNEVISNKDLEEVSKLEDGT